MDIGKLSSRYMLKRLGDCNVQEVLRLCCGNRLYYEYCPPFPTEESIKEDMLALPPDVAQEDKFYIGFYDEGKLIAVMDLIDGYPKRGVAFIGFFMTDTETQGKGIGSEIISALCDSLKQEGFASVRLAWVKGNPQAEHFWQKNMFAPIKETTGNVPGPVILAKRIL